ncbi:hypothetical protein LWI28_024241 [Acer negundo]|uniref:Uncharacterized protein n=1 Tax=Acer negundo TaxID=4023 RepID=A0AAD5P306_ACENE|nr:hypothetical protein LWI28_024241 [Acer negundo]
MHNGLFPKPAIDISRLAVKPSSKGHCRLQVCCHHPDQKLQKVTENKTQRLSKAYVSPSLVAFPLVFCLGCDFALEDLLRWDYSKRTILLALVEPSKQGAPLSSGQGRFQEELEKQVFHLFTNSFKE